jgi:cupin fold WbuC family metalloprotein
LKRFEIEETRVAVQELEIMENRVVRLSGMATISRHEKAFAVTPAIVDAKSADAKSNPRKREILVLHRGDSDLMQRMLNALEPGSYIRPHRHNAPPRPETLVLLRGSLCFAPFLQDGTPDTENFIFLNQQGALAVDCREGVWHTFFAVEPHTVIFEVKPGPYDMATDKEFANWAPAENAADAPSYLARLEQIFRAKFSGALP